MVYELIAYNTDQRYDDVRYREYTSSEKKAKLFSQIPKIQFTDSGHGIVFSAREHKGKRKPCVTVLSDYVRKNLRILKEKNTIKSISKLENKVFYKEMAEEIGVYTSYEEMMVRCNQPLWEDDWKVHCWKNYILSSTKKNWNKLKVETKLVLLVLAEKQSNDEAWD